jgi:hypothetical protein
MYLNIEKHCGEMIFNILFSKRAVPRYIIDLSRCSRADAGGRWGNGALSPGDNLSVN